MQASNCIREACFNTCCSPPLLHTSPPPSSEFVSAIASTLHPHTVFTNHESLPPPGELLSSLTAAIPSYSNNPDATRARVSLDYVGHGLFSHAQAEAHERFFDFAYGGAETALHAAAKRRVMKYMNLSEEDYMLVFTANQSSAFSLLAQSYPFESRQNLVTVYDHDSEALKPMTDAAGKCGGLHQSATFSWPGLRIISRKLRKILTSKNRGLLAFPLQSKVSGARYSYEWMNLARENGWHVLLDASALAAKEMETLGLSLFHPDFIICSFFKIFGENPSGFCCLAVKKSSASILKLPSTNMGIVNLVPEPKAVDETNSTTNDEVIEFGGLDDADELGLIGISRRVRCLVNWVVNALQSLRHPGGEGLALVEVYGPGVRVDRGAAVAFNVCDWKGERVEPGLVQKLADRSNISLGIGFLNNICFGEERRKKKKKKKRRSGVGVVTASLGMLSDFEDVYRLWAFVARFLDADFVEKEKWRYTKLNQTTVEV